MEGWAGFTDSDLKKLKSHTHSDSLASNQSRTAAKRGQQPVMAVRRPASSGQKRPAARKVTPEGGHNRQGDANLTPSQTLSKPAEKTPENTGALPEAESSTSATSKPAPSTDTGSHRHSREGSTAEEVTENDKEKEMIVDDQEIFKHESHTMESFQKQQKVIEELNKKKKQMLSTAIKERAKKAKAESAKLTEIQKELSKLDVLLTVDVSIIRDKIENACREFFDAQKRYDRAEKEYIDSKIDLHQKMEHKEQLTEHLYTVIYQNEMRKSKKLAELMHKLEMEASGDLEEQEIPECDMPHPSLISPVQLPVGRYGQIGLVKVDVTQTTGKEAAEKDAAAKDDGKETVASVDGKTDGEKKDDATAVKEGAENSKDSAENDSKDVDSTKASPESGTTAAVKDDTSSSDGKAPTEEVKDEQTETTKGSKDVNENSAEAPKSSSPTT